MCVCACVCVYVCLSQKEAQLGAMAYRHFEISVASKGQGVLEECSRTPQTFKGHRVLEEYSVTPQSR